MAPRALEQLIDGIARTQWLDKVAVPANDWVGRIIPQGPVKGLLSGTWMGHPLHPVLTDLPIGFWTSAMAIDFLGGRRGQKAADRLVALGVLTAVPTAATGLSDWSDTIGEDRRLGLAHAAGNVVAVGLYGWSWVARKRGRRAKGVTLGVLGATAATAGAYLGGHLVWRKGVNIDRHAWDHAADDWVGVTLEAPLEEGVPVVVDAGGDAVLVVRRGEAIHAISDVCSHMGGPLHEGEMSADPLGGCVTCPWHASRFRLDDGSVAQGPATGPQPAYDVRLEGDRLALRRRPTVTPTTVAPATAATLAHEVNGQDSWPSSSSTPPTGTLQA
ncbi:MAG TPA: Rieske 2Fe-2S domain-containing protein [Acidimicrobiales bacterium]|nr:Rieske 2Fe-2S domain-containing protein [Acidimicrobiales bacterium]